VYPSGWNLVVNVAAEKVFLEHMQKIVQLHPDARFLSPDNSATSNADFKFLSDILHLIIPFVVALGHSH